MSVDIQKCFFFHRKRTFVFNHIYSLFYHTIMLLVKKDVNIWLLDYYPQEAKTLQRHRNTEILLLGR